VTTKGDLPGRCRPAPRFSLVVDVIPSHDLEKFDVLVVEPVE
jgi:hypothetical protein